MNFLKKVFNSFAWQMGKYIFFVILLALIIFLKGSGVFALEATMWGNSLENHINSLTSTSNYTYADYNSDTIKEFIFNRSNEQFFDNTYTQAQFYKHYNYVVLGYSQTTIRVFVQNYDRVMDYQGLNAIEGNPTRFFFANMTMQYRAGTSVYWGTGVNAIYSYYIDINYNTMSYTFSDNNPLTDLNFYLLGKGRHYTDSNKPFGSTDINMQLLDSYNGNFSWIESWYSSENTESLWYQCSGYTTTSTILNYYNSIVEFPEFQYVSSGTPEEEPEEPGGSGGGSTTPDYSSVLDQMKEDLNKIADSIGDGINDVINGISDTLSDISNAVTDFFTDFFDNLIDVLISLFVPDDLDKAEELYENIKSKLGFIVEVPELLITFMFDLINAEWEKVTSLTFPSVDIFGYNFWDEKEIDLLPILNVIEPYKIYTDIACVGLMIIGCINLYEKFTGGDN